MPRLARRDIVRPWALRIIADLRSTNRRNIPASQDNAAMLINDLRARFPDEAFTEESYQGVISALRPNAGSAEIVSALGRWWAEHRPTQPELPGADTDLSQEARVWFAIWENDKGAGFPQPKTADTSLDMIRAHQSALFVHLVRNDPVAFEIADRKGWTDYLDPKRGWTEAAIRKHVDGFMSLPPQAWNRAANRVALDTLRACVSKFAPEHLGLVPDTPVPDGAEPRTSSRQNSEFVAQAAAAFEAQHGRKPGELTAEQLQQLRQTNERWQAAQHQQAGSR